MDKPKLSCSFCGKCFTQKNLLSRHKNLHCNLCDDLFSRKMKLINHICPTMQNNESNRFKRKHMVLQATIFPIKENENNIQAFLSSIKQDVFNELSSQLKEKKEMTWYAIVKTVVSKSMHQHKLKLKRCFLYSDVLLELASKTLTDHIEEAFEKILEEFSDNQGWRFEKIQCMNLETAVP